MSLCAKPWAKRFTGGCKEVEGLLIGVPGWWAWGKEASPLGKCGQAEVPPLLPRGWRAAPGGGVLRKRGKEQEVTQREGSPHREGGGITISVRGRLWVTMMLFLTKL